MASESFSTSATAVMPIFTETPADVVAHSKPAPVRWERLMTRLGSPGRFQTVVFVLLASNYIAVAFNHLFPVLYAQKPREIYCVPDQFDFTKYGKVKTSHHDFMQYTCPATGSDQKTNDTACTSSLSSGFVYEYPLDGQFSLAGEWDLICSRENLIGQATSFYFCGVMLGGLIFGYLSDHYGRRPILFCCMLCEALLGIAVYFIHGYSFFVFIKMLQGMLLQGMQSTSYVLMMEYFHSRHRTLVGTIAEDFWAVGVILLALIGFMLRNWRHIQLACSLLSLIGLLYFFVIEESIRWLLTTGRTKQALAVARRIVAFNKQSNYAEIEAIILDSAENMPADNFVAAKNAARRYNFRDLFSTPVLRFRIITMSFIWFTTACVYYGLSFKLADLPVDIYASLLIGGITEAVAYTGSSIILSRYGRRRPLCCYFAIAGVMTVLAGCMPKTWSSSLRFMLVIGGRMGVAGALSVIFLYATELFPTVVRNLAFGFCSCILRFGGILAPQINSLGASLFAELPFIVFGQLALVAAVASMMLPETSGRPLPDELADVEPGGRRAGIIEIEATDIIIPNSDEYEPVQAVLVNGNGSANLTNDNYKCATPSPTSTLSMDSIAEPAGLRRDVTSNLPLT